MTTTVNGNEATSEVSTDGQITLTVNGQSVSLTADQVTAVTDALLSARKDAYAITRAGKQAERDAKKAESAAKKAQRLKDQKAKREAQLKKLEAKLAELKKAA